MQVFFSFLYILEMIWKRLWLTLHSETNANLHIAPNKKLQNFRFPTELMQNGGRWLIVLLVYQNRPSCLPALCLRYEIILQLQYNVICSRMTSICDYCSNSGRFFWSESAAVGCVIGCSTLHKRPRLPLSLCLWAFMSTAGSCGKHFSLKGTRAVVEAVFCRW